MKRLGLLFVLFFAVSPMMGQGYNMDVIANINDYPTSGYTDCWGYEAPDGTQYALLGVVGGVSIIDVTDAASSAEVEFVPWVFGGWYDIKTYGEYMYVSSEAINSVIVVDLSDLPNSASIVGSVTDLPTSPHNIFVDTQTGHLYIIEDNYTPSISIWSLADPMNPEWVGDVSGVGNDCHDLYVRDNILYSAEGVSPTIAIIDVSDPSDLELIQRVTVPSAGYVHQVWVNDDHTLMVTTEETPLKTVKLWDISDLDNVEILSSYLGTSDLAHNAYMQDEYLVISHYESGVTVVDYSDPTDIVEVGYYDTYAPGDEPNFNGAWGAWPFFGLDKILGSDQADGLYVFDFDSVRAGGVTGIVTDLVSGEPVEGATVSSIETGHYTETDDEGSYELRLGEGDYSLEFTKLGYFADTVDVSFGSGASIEVNQTLEANLAELELSAEVLEMSLEHGEIGTMTLVISNDGPGGILDYVIDDINGPIPPAQEPQPTGPIDLTDAIEAIHASGMTVPAPPVESVQGGDTLIVDPEGDQVQGFGGDIVLITASTGFTIHVEMHLAHEIDLDSTFGFVGFDTDFNSDTGNEFGALGGLTSSQDVGTEFDVFVDVPGVIGFGQAAFLFDVNGGFLNSYTIILTDSTVSFSIPLSDMSGEDGNMAVATSMYEAVFNGYYITPTSIDYAPDVGHGLLGEDPLADLTWLDLSQESGTLGGGEADTIQVTFNATAVEDNTLYDGILSLFTNDADESVVAIPVTMIVGDPVGIDNPAETVTSFRLNQNYPNPFNPTTTISYELPVSASVSLNVYDLTGRLVRTLVDGTHHSASAHKVTWDGTNNAGFAVTSGVYFYRLEVADKFETTKKMYLIR